MHIPIATLIQLKALDTIPFLAIPWGAASLLFTLRRTCILSLTINRLSFIRHTTIRINPTALLAHILLNIQTPSSPRTCNTV